MLVVLSRDGNIELCCLPQFTNVKTNAISEVGSSW
jgi:hypothetical protein